MVGAIDAAQLGGISANQAAKMFGMPYSTLKDHHITDEAKHGPSPYLSAKEDDELKIT